MRDNYLDPTVSAERRASSLLEQMTLKEKIGQLCQFVGLGPMEEGQRLAESNDDDSTAVYPDLRKADVLRMTERGEIGSFLSVQTQEEADTLQRAALRSRLSIPALIATDAIHGHAMLKSGATVFASPLTYSFSWDKNLACRIAQATARELRATGFQWTFSPNVDLALDARWGRCGETFGEDPLLAGELGAAMIEGYQDEGLNGESRVLACVKHFIAGGDPADGLNFSPMDVSDRSLQEFHFPPFKKAIDAGALTCMAAHNEINGVPCHGNEWLLRDKLRDDLGFGGLTVSDWNDVARLHSLHKVAESFDEANCIALRAGIDMYMHGPGYFESIEKQVLDGRIGGALVDEACWRILMCKFKIGLFEQPLALGNSETVVLCEAHRDLAYESARESIVLLKNENEILPLKKGSQRILVTGPCADDQSILGDWALTQERDLVTTVLDGIKNEAGSGCSVFHSSSGAIEKIDDEAIERVSRAAAKADIAIVAVGENGLRDSVSLRTCGENLDRSDIELPGRQLDLIKSIHATGAEVVLVLVGGRPLAIEWCADNIPAILFAGEPGMAGGKALGKILFGSVNPSGKLTMTFPRSAGHLKYPYHHRPSKFFRTYILSRHKALYPFGCGLSYTEFEYSSLTIPEEVEYGDSVSISLTVKNSGKLAGEEVVMVFVTDCYSSVTTPVKLLKRFERVLLQSGEALRLEFTLKFNELELLDENLDRVVEPGDFQVRIGYDDCLVETFRVLEAGAKLLG
ncbi:glycoside hydrolase family 3 C-terminal domain-containing protein [Puniceicoccaceae bacterium K14]|nr:glycoside hydrolase family 3 C-terminal domain-containing protein [Puniceicoccaceae bacterium K14]